MERVLNDGRVVRTWVHHGGCRCEVGVYISMTIEIGAFLTLAVSANLRKALRSP